MKILVRFFLLSFVISCHSCKRRHSTFPDPECVDKNNSGIELIVKYQQGKSSDLTKAISFFKDAIKCDPKYSSAYTNLALVYDYKKNYGEELNVYNKILSFSDNDPSILTEKGIVFEKLKLIDSAKIIYQLARQKFEDKLKTHPSNITYIQGLLMILALTEGKESALRELNKQVTSNPELASKMVADDYFYQHFDKSAYIFHLSQ